MKALVYCDGCGKEGKLTFSPVSQAFHKPRDWYQRSDDDGVQIACSRQCIKTIAEKTGKTPLVLPV